MNGIERQAAVAKFVGFAAARQQCRVHVAFDFLQ
jgi:hypothetical protein